MKRKRLYLMLLYALAFFVITVIIAFVLFRAQVDDPEVILGDGILGANIQTEDAVRIIMETELYKRFDRIKEITEINAYTLLNDEPEHIQLYTILQNSIEKRIENEVYFIRVDSTSKCLTTSYLIFYVDSSSGEILRTIAWKQCLSEGWD